MVFRRIQRYGVNCYIVLDEAATDPEYLSSLNSPFALSSVVEWKAEQSLIMSAPESWTVTRDTDGLVSHCRPETLSQEMVFLLSANAISPIP